MLRTIRTGAAGVALLALMAAATTVSAQITPIDDIQVYSATGAAASPYAGQIRTVRGAISVLKGTYNGGTHYVQDATGGIQFFQSAAPALTYGDTVEVSGLISTFSGEIQLGSSVSVTFINSGVEPAPILLTVTQATDFDNSGTVTAEDYELVGSMVAVDGIVSYINGLPPGNPALGSNGSFNLVSGTGDTILVFCDVDTHVDLAGLGDGELYRIISPMVNFNTLLELKPRRQSDLVSGDPLITNVTPNPWSPLSSQPITVTANIVDPNGTISSATLFYRNEGALSYSSTAMSPIGGGDYSAIIPTPHSAPHVEYYISATDNSAVTATFPGNAPTSALQVAVGTVPIPTIQSTIAGVVGNPYASAFVDSLVNTEGVVTVAPGALQVGIQSQYIIEAPAGGAWSGIFVFEGSAANTFFPGDRIRISGRVNEFSGTTQIIPQRGDAVTLVSFGNDLPPVDRFACTFLDTTEAYENVIVRTFVTTVADTVGPTDFWASDGGDSLLFVDPAPGVTVTGTEGGQAIVQGLLDGRFGTNELTPITDSDMAFFVGVDETNRPTRHAAYIQSVSPNPFNPRTTVEFVLPAKGLTELAIFNQRGERVRTLISETLEAGPYALAWDGTDGNGSAVGSGVYYARLRHGSEMPKVAKLSLVK